MYGKEYQHNGKTYRLALPSAEYFRRLSLVEHRVKAHQANENRVGPYEEIAETWAIMLGISAKEAAELSVSFLIDVMKDMEATTDAMKKAMGK